MKKRAIILSCAAVVALGGSVPSIVPASGPSSAAMPKFQPTRFSVAVKGAGPDVILVPGLSSSRDIWSSAVASVPGYRYHLVQVAGFAGEPVRGNAEGPVVPSVADEIARYIEARALKRPALVGHSMGGTIAMMIAARHPHLAGKIMVVDMLPQPSGLFGSSATGVRGLADGLREIAAMPGGKRLVSSIFSTFGAPGGGGSRSDPDVVARAAHELALIDLAPDLPRIAAPATIVYAADDEASPAEIMDRRYSEAYARLKGAKLVRIDRSGHMIMLDQPQRFAAVMKSFLAN